MYKTIIVVDSDDTGLAEAYPNVISFEQYLRDYPKRSEPKTRIINLCDTAHYLSKGYYCSLLAEARNHAVLPSVKTINALRRVNDNTAELDVFLSEESVEPPCLLYFGKTEDPAHKKIASRIFGQYAAPLLKLSMQTGKSMRIDQLSLAQLSAVERQRFIERLDEFTRTVWRINRRQKHYRWDMAILVKPDDRIPPSNKEALSRFVKAAAKHDIHAELVTAEELKYISHYDALFIRETTAIDHYTYELACKAEKHGLVVIDDPSSILRCCNKVFLHDAFSYQKVPSLNTRVIGSASDSAIEELEKAFTYPLVLKMPEGSFSNGVFKVSNKTELKQQLERLFQQSALVLAQEYLYTEFDWRIGILNGRAIYACRYLMARNHWQIYNHSAKRFTSGDFETLPTFEVPRSVLDAALKAASTVGDGLYGVDVKELDGKAYVLEVNDNPSIEHKIEDAYLGDELYMQIMSEFKRRLEVRGQG